MKSQQSSEKTPPGVGGTAPLQPAEGKAAKPQRVDDRPPTAAQSEERPARLLRAEDKPPSAYTHDWSEKVEALLADWRLRVYAAQSAHYASADRFRALNYIVGVPAIIFSSIVGTAIFASLEQDSRPTLIVGVASILAAVLTGLQTFLRFPERAAHHASAADWYSAIRRDIEETLHLPCDSRGRVKDCLDRIRKEMNRAGQDAPELNVRLWKREARRFGVKEPLPGA